MKYIYAMLLLIICSPANAQVQVGAKGGISIPNLKGNNEQSKGYTSRQGGYGGLLINFKVTPLFSLQPEINYSPQGGQRKGMQQVPSDAITGITLPPNVSLYASFKSVTSLNYIEIPLLAKIELGQKFKYYACLGPHVAFLVESKTKTSGESPLYLDAGGTIPLMQNGSAFPPVSFNNTTDINKSIKNLNAGFQGGLGFQFPAGPGKAFLEGRAIIGLTNIQTHPETDGKNKTGSLAVAAGYIIKIQ